MRKEDKSGPIEILVVPGIVEAKECRCCGHHEVGLRVNEEDGAQFIQLKPGDRIELEITEKAFDRRTE